MYASTTYTGDGVTTTFTIPFGYLVSSDLSITVDGTPISDLTFPSVGSVTLAVAPANGTEVVIARTTDVEDPAVVFGNTTLTAADLNTSASQCLFSTQETRDILEGIAADLDSGAVVADLIVPVGANQFLVSTGAGVWALKSVAQVLGILGTSSLPAAVLGDKFLTTDLTTNVYELSTAAEARAKLGLGDLATTNLSGLGLGTAAALTAGSAIGNVPVLGNVGGAAAMPAVDGSLLTGVVAPQKFLGLTRQASYNTGGGVYGGGSQAVGLNTVSGYSTLTGYSLDTGTGYFTLPAGRYKLDARLIAANIGVALISIDKSDNSVSYMHGETISTGTANPNYNVMCAGGEFTLASATALRLNVSGTATNASGFTLGYPHGSVGLGNNIYATVNIWKVS